MFNNLAIYILAVILSASAALTSCSKDSGANEPDPPVTPTPTPEPEPEPEPTDIEANYFTASLTGNTLPDLGNATPITADKLEATRTELWAKWKTANDAMPQKLPTAQSFSATSYSLEPNGSWQVPDGNMKFAYVTKGAKPDGGYPMFIALHGSGTDSYYDWSAVASWCNYFQDAPSTYFIPLSPKGGSDCRWYQPSRQEIWERAIRLAYGSSE